MGSVQAISRRIVALIILLGPTSHAVFEHMDLGIDVPWWRPFFCLIWYVVSDYVPFLGQSLTLFWFSFLFWTIDTPCRFFVHVTLFPYLACRRREPNLVNPCIIVGSECPWDDCASLPAVVNNEKDPQIPTIYHIKRQKGQIVWKDSGSTSNRAFS